MSAVVELAGVSRRYGRAEGAVQALREVDLAVAETTFTAIMGPSGSGKSTLLRCAAGLERPDTGRVLLAGAEVSALREPRLTRERRARCGFVFQSYNLISTLTVRQNVELPARLAGSRPRRGRVAELLDAVGLAGRERARPAELSGGQRQRVAIARALLHEPAVVFADEPTGALDRATGDGVLTLLRQTVDRYRRTVVMVTHDPVAAAAADRVVVLVDGAVHSDLARPTADQIAAHLAALGR